MQIQREAAKIAHTLTQEIQMRNVNAKVFIIADTIDGSCQVDEITAEHLGADCVVSHGRKA